VKYLIDTHILLRIISDSPKISKNVRKIYLNAENTMYLSLASVWEMAIKISLGKLSINRPLGDFVNEHVLGNNIQILKIQLSHVLSIETLPFHHRDPFDRMIIAQGIEDNIPIISADTTFDLYPVKRIY